MKCARIFVLLSAVLATAFNAISQQQRTSATTVSGVYSVTFNLNIASTLPADTTITCRAQIAPNSSDLALSNPGRAVTPVAAGQATVSGSQATCAAEIPFSWTLTAANDTVTLSYQIDAVSRSGAVRSSARQTVRAGLPASGGANLHVNATI
jgi:hypothetical protein